MENEKLIPLMTPISEEKKKELQALNSIKEGEQYKYLILLEGEYKQGDGEHFKSFELITGRQEAYDFIKDLLEHEYEDDFEYILDTSLSRVLSEPPAWKVTKSTPRLTLSNMLSVHSFMKLMKEKGKVKDESSFDITSYFDDFFDDNTLPEK